MHGKFRESATGELADYQYLVCSSSRHKNERCGLPNFRYQRVEEAIAMLAAVLGEANRDSSSDGFAEFIGKAKFKLQDDYYRAKFIAALRHEVETCTFLRTGEIEVKVFGKRVMISNLK